MFRYFLIFLYLESFIKIKRTKVISKARTFSFYTKLFINIFLTIKVIT